MKKKIKLKWLTMSVFALGAISVIPIITTSCSDNDEDNEENSSNENNDGDTSGEGEIENEGEPINNENENYQTINNTLTFASYYSSTDENIDESVISNIINIITPGYELNMNNIGNSEIWILNENTSDNYTVYDLTITSENIEYAKNFIGLSDVWYNQTKEINEESKVGLSVELNQSDINYNVLSNWNVLISLSVNSDFSDYQLVYEITPKDEENSDTIGYQFTLYSQDNFYNYFEIVGPGTSPINDLNNYQIDENVYKFATYAPGTKYNVNKSSMDGVAITISGYSVDNANFWSYDESSYTYTLISVDDYTIQAFLTAVSSTWKNYYSDSEEQNILGVDFDVETGFNYDALSSHWNLSISASTNSGNSYWRFTFMITPNENNTSGISYQFGLFNAYNYNTTFGTNVS